MEFRSASFLVQKAKLATTAASVTTIALLSRYYAEHFWKATDFTHKDAFVEVAHEALIRNWLRQWLDENRAGLLLHHRISEVAQEWRERNEAELNLIEREFLDTSIAERQKLERAAAASSTASGWRSSLVCSLIYCCYWRRNFGFRQKIEAEKEIRRAESPN